jgi:hypothetical protein
MMEDLTFHEFFGCGPDVAMIAWDLLHLYALMPDGGGIHHYLWALMWLKVYSRLRVMTALCGRIDKETMMKWVMKFIYAIAYLEPFVVSVYCLSSCFAIQCILSPLTLLLLLLLLRLYGRIDTEETAVPIVLLLLIALMSSVQTGDLHSLPTSMEIKVAASGMRSHIHFKLVISGGSMVHIQLVDSMM